MRAVPANSPYEVYCPRCRVSYPVETRSCIHCGQPIGRSLGQSVLPRRPVAAEEEVAPDELPIRAFKASPLTIVWLLAGVATVAYRACTS